MSAMSTGMAPPPSKRALGVGPTGRRSGKSRAAGGPAAVVLSGNVGNHVTQFGGKREIRRGDLIFDANFENGNLGKVEMTSEFEYDCYIRPDTGNHKQRIWFNFTVRNGYANQHVIFNVVNYCKCKASFRDGMAPVVRSKARPEWERMRSESTFYYKCPNRRRGYVVSFAFIIDDPQEVYEIAFCFPYSYSRVQSYLSSVCSRKAAYVKRERLATTVQKRRLDLLTISSPENLARIKDGTGPPFDTVVVTSRVHPGETPSSFVVEGFIDFILSEEPEAIALRNRLVIKVVPMLNPDGVFLGNYRCSSIGQDLNRCYQSPKQWNHPEIYAVKQMLMQLTKDKQYSMHFYMDLHAHTCSTNSFLYGNWYRDENRMSAQWVFPRILSAHADDFSQMSTDFNSDKAKAGTGRRSLSLVLSPKAQIFTLEVSFYGYKTHEDTPIVPYSENRYRQLGSSIGKTLLDYYT